ncbi:helicase-related protein, partial [Duncaniella dubosii]|uniref:MuF-C-terminal domain-containing protein n=1 Tax=Duncaniella dubosii TaxID=2518971 RepID=UPI0023EFE059
EGRILAIYIGLDPVAERGTRRRGDNLAVERILYRVENPNGSGMERWGYNMYAPVESTYADFLRRVKEITRDYLPKEKSVDELWQEWSDMAERGESPYTITPEVEAQPAEERKVDVTHNGYKVGDEVMWDRYGNGNWEKVKIEDFDTDGRPIFEAVKGVMSEKGDWSRVKPADGIFGEAKRVARAAQEKKSAPAKKKTAVKPEQPVAELFGGLFDEPINDEKKTDVQPRPGTAERERGHESQSHESLGESQRNEVKGTDGRGMGGRDSVNPMSDRERGAGVPRKPKSKPVAEPLAESDRRNVRNNHAERGTDYAPKGEDARIKANIEAIELAKRLLDTGESATPEQMAVLRRFSGWGGLGKAFNESNNIPNPTAKRLRELLGEDGYNDAVMSRNSAYFTPAPVIDAMWNVAKAMGFTGGNVLEGSAGIGNILGLMPVDLSDRSSIHAVEIDRTTGGILSLLYPDAKVGIQGFEKTRISNNSIDLAITNVPFVTGLRVMDETGDKDLSKKFRDIHDFCIAKNIRKLREGGIGIFITSSGTMDNSKELRRWIINEGNADVVGAFRMHNKTFGGTGATSDIIVVRKRVNGKPSPNAIDVTDVAGVRVADYDTGETRKVKGQEIPIVNRLTMDYNKYFAEHPENMAGEMRFGFEEGDTFRPKSKALYPVRGKEQSEMLTEWAGRFADMEEEAAATPNVEDEVTRINEQLGEGVKEGSMVLNSQGELCMARMGEAVPLGLNKNKVKGHTKAECFNAYTAIKKALSNVLEYQSNHESDEGLAPLLKELNRAFDTFTRTYGNLHKNTAISFLRNDVDFSSILALETYSEKGDKRGNKVVKVGKTDIFSRRVIETEKEPQPTTIKDGILASLYKSGGIDVEYIGQALGKSTEDVKREIVESGLGFENPSTGAMEVSYQYLSGNVREKLHIAQENNDGGRYDANIKALENVMPMTIPAHLIEFALGSSWIEPKLYEDFVYEKTGIRVTLTNAGGTWFMKTPWNTFNEKNRAMAVVSKMCDKTIMGHELIESAITNKQITVSKTIKHYDGTTETITDKTATAECGTKVDEIRAEFKDWAREHMQADPEMSARIERTYNERFNNYVPMSIPDEFVPQHFGGQVSELHGRPFALRPHQGRAVVRGTTEPVLLAHEVGAGKTYTLITTAMEMRRLGTARKPMIVVQNATVGQFVESAKEIYPNAKVLTIEEADRTADGRKNFYAKIKYNDWDMIVVPQSVFERIPDSPEREMAYVKDIIEEKMKVLEAMREADSDGRSMIVRQAEKELAEQEERLAELTEAMQGKKKKRDEKKEATTRQNAEVKALEMLDREVDDVENFDDMGIDAILVDEAHEYKHLGFATAMQRGVKGVDPSFSKKSQGVFLKAQAVMERNNGRNVVFATGTPISNTAAEIWTFMRYLMPVDKMKSYEIYYFDDFVRNFGNIAQMVEFGTNGKFKENNRFAGYFNLPELVRIWSSVADTVLTREAGGVSDKIPDMEGGKPQDIYLPQTRALRSVMKYVKSELDRFEEMTGKEKKENSHIPLTMYGIAKAAAIDVRLVVPNAEDDPNSKTNATVRETLRSLKDSAKYKGTVAIFSDNYQNNQSGFNLYEDIRKKLIAEGVPADQIVVIKSGMTVKKKLDIFEKVNAGEIRVIMGSTFTLGTGVNIQERLHTLIHVDAPNRPMDYTQRNGRAMRQGNLHKDMGIPVRIIRFGVEDSLDVTAYQRLKTKGAIVDSIMNSSKMMQNSMENRVLEEEEDSFGDMTAQLSGSEYAILKNQAEREVRNLTAKQKGHDIDQIYVHNQLPKVEGFIKGAEDRIALETKKLEIIGKHFPDGTIKKITIGKLTFDSVAAMEDFFKEQNAKMNEAAEAIREGADNYTSRLTVDVDGLQFEITTTVGRAVDKNGQGTLIFEPERNVTYSCEALGIRDEAVKGNRIKNVMQRITEDIATGNSSRELLNRGQQQLAHYSEEYRLLQERNGREFPYKVQLVEAKERLAKYEEAMRKELEEKEAKYAEMDKSVDAASDIALTDEDSEGTPTNGDGNKYRDGEMSDGERLRAIRALVPVAVERNNMSRAELFAEYRTLPDVAKDGINIQFLRTAFGKNYKEGGLFAQVVPQLDALLEGSILAYSEKDSLGGMQRPDGTEHKAHPNVISFDNYVNKALIADKEYYVRMTVQKTRDNTTGLHSCFVSNVDIYEKTATSETDSAIVRRPNQPYDGITDAKLQKFFERASSEELELDKADRVMELSERLGMGVRVISDQSGIDRLPSARHRRAKGYFDTSTGEVVIVLPNNRDVADVDNTFVHEVVGHKGLRAFIGEERFDEFLGEVYNHASNPIRKVIDKKTDDMVNAEADRLRVHKAKARERAGEDVNSSYYADMAEARVEAEAKREEFRKEATEEYMSDLGGRIGSEGFEKMSRDELTLWGKIKAKVQSFLDKFLRGLKIAKSIRLNDKDLSYILYKSWKNLRDKQGKGGVFAEAEDVVMRRRTGWDDAMLSESAKVEDANNRFNRELQQQIDGTFSDGHIYQLGNPGTILRSTGVPNLPIQMSATRLRVKATEYGHDFDLAEIRNLVKEMQTPMAVFAYGNKGKMQNIIVGIGSNGKQFIVGLSLNPIVNGKALEINSIRNVFPKNNAEWLNWISQGKLLYADKQKIQALIDKQRTILTDVAYLDLEDVAKVIKTFENPTFYGDEDVRFRDGADYVERVPVMARAMYEKHIQSSMYQFTEAMQDSMRGLLEFYKAVESQGAKRDIEDVASFENAYIAENLMSSKSHAEMEEYEHRIMRPLLDIAARMSVDKRGRQELIDYMMAKHGLERNAYMRSEAIGNGEESERDFAGLCGLTGEQDWQDAETAAQQIVNDYEAAHSADIAGLWEAVNKATKTSLKKVYDCGLLSREQYEKIRDMYDHYIPLQGFDEKTGDDVYGYLTSKGGAFSSPVKKAEGRKSKADDPLATIAYMAQNSIIQGNRNVMKQKFLMYVQNHPSDLASVNRLWLAHDETTDTWKPVFADVDENMTGDEINEAVMDFEQRMESLSQSEPDKYKRGRDAVSIPYRLVDGNIKEHQVLVKRNGESYVITINGNPRAAQAVNGLTNPDNDLNGAIGKVFNVAETVNRQLSQFYTTRNPDFSVANFIRDLIYSNTMVHVKENQGYAMRFHKNHAKVNPMRMIRLLHLYEADRLNMHNPTHRMFYEFMHWGGETGYTMQRDLDQEKKLVAKLMKEARWKRRESLTPFGHAGFDPT